MSELQELLVGKFRQWLWYIACALAASDVIAFVGLHGWLRWLVIIVAALVWGHVMFRVVNAFARRLINGPR